MFNPYTPDEHISKYDLQRRELHKNILRSLLDGPKTFYDLAKKENLGSNQTILKALDNLRQDFPRKMINKGDPEGPRGSINYNITGFGIYHYLYGYADEILDKIDNIARKHSEKILLFKYWEILKTKKITDDLKKRIRTDPKGSKDKLFNQNQFSQKIDEIKPFFHLIQIYLVDLSVSEDMDLVKVYYEKINAIVGIINQDEVLRIELASMFLTMSAFIGWDMIRLGLIYPKIKNCEVMKKELEKYPIKEYAKAIIKQESRPGLKILSELDDSIIN